MKIAFYGSSLLSSYWNGAATYYRGLLGALAERGWDILFLEPDAFDRQQHRDIDPPDWAEVVVWDNTVEGCKTAMARAVEADVVVKASGVGVFDDVLLGVFDLARPDALTVYWDVDAPATLAEVKAAPHHPLRRVLPQIDHVLTYGGGAPVVQAFQALGARDCRPIYNALDPATHHPVQPDPGFSADLALLANRLPDRERRIETFFLEPAAALPQRRFLLGGNGWADKAMPANVQTIGHVGTAQHNAFNCTPLAVLNVARDSMAEVGFSPATRVFEATGVAGSTMVAYASILSQTLPNAAGHVLVASIVSAPAGVLLARIIVPEPDKQAAQAISYDSALKYDSAIDAISKGTSDGLMVVLNISAVLIVFVALVALVNIMLGGLIVFGEPLTVERILGVLFTPLAWLIGVDAREAGQGGWLLGVKLALTEFVAFIDLGKIPAEAMSERTRMLMTYALCGFANIGSVGITVTGLSVLMPERRHEVLGLIWKALFAGFMATLMSAAIVGALPATVFGQ